VGQHQVSGTIADREGGPSPLELWINVVREESTELRPALIELGVINTGESEASYTTGVPEPFAVLYADDEVLWTDAYKESSCILTLGKGVKGGCDAGIEIVIQPDERRSETYEFHAPKGAYIVNQTKNPFEIDRVQYTVERIVE